MGGEIWDFDPLRGVVPALAGSDELRRAVAEHLHRMVNVTVSHRESGGPLVSISGSLEGVVDVPSESDPPVSIVVGSQSITVWHEDLLEATIVKDTNGFGFTVDLPSGHAISVDRIE